MNGTESSWSSVNLLDVQSSSTDRTHLGCFGEVCLTRIFRTEGCRQRRCIRDIIGVVIVSKVWTNSCQELTG